MVLLLPIFSVHFNSGVNMDNLHQLSNEPFTVIKFECLGLVEMLA